MSRRSRSRSRSRDRKDDAADDTRSSSSSSNLNSNSSASTLTTSNDTRFVKFLIPIDHAGSVIGTKGKTIKDIATKSKAECALSKRADPLYPGRLARIGKVEGTNEQVLVALSLILKSINESMINKAGGNRDEVKGFDVTILVPEKCCGAVIGPKGATVKKLQEDSRATIRVENTPEISNFTRERSILITSEELQGVLHAIGGILEALQHGKYPPEYWNKGVRYDRHDFRPRNAERHDGGPHFDRDPRGARGGPGSHMNGGFDDRRHGRHGEYRREGDFDRRGGRVGGSGGGGGRPMGSFDDRHHGRNGDYRREDDFGRRGGGDMHMHMHHNPHNRNDGAGGVSRTQITQEVQVADDLIGRVVGKKGSHIEHIERQSGASISISKRGEFYPNTKNRIITILADTEEQQRLVQKMIQEAISDPEVSKVSSGESQGNQHGGLSGDRLMNECMKVGPGTSIPNMYIIAIPNECVGSIMGPKGAHLHQMRNTTHATIEVSRKNVFFPNTEDRIVVLKGNNTQMSTCQTMIIQALNHPKSQKEKEYVERLFHQFPLAASHAPPPPLQYSGVHPLQQPVQLLQYGAYSQQQQQQQMPVRPLQPAYHQQQQSYAAADYAPHNNGQHRESGSFGHHQQHHQQQHHHHQQQQQQQHPPSLHQPPQHQPPQQHHQNQYGKTDFVAGGGQGFGSLGQSYGGY